MKRIAAFALALAALTLGAPGSRGEGDASANPPAELRGETSGELREETSGALREETPAERRQAQLSQRLQRLREEIADTHRREDVLAEELSSIDADEASLRDDLAKVGRRVAALESRIATHEGILSELGERQAELKEGFRQREGEIAALMMALQRLGRRPPPALLSENDGALGAVRGAILINALLPRLETERRALVATLDEADRTARQERERWERLREDLDTVARERANLQGLASELERRRSLSSYERDRTRAELARLGAQSRSVEELIAALGRGDGAAEEAPLDFTGHRGRLVQPVAGELLARYGDATATGDVSQGRTIAALPDATVIAPVAGTVVFAGPFRSYGEVLIIDAGGGYHMVLAGLESAFVGTGTAVDAGRPLGRMGARSAGAPSMATNRQSAEVAAGRPLLYVELRKDGSAIDGHGWWRSASSKVEG